MSGWLMRSGRAARVTGKVRGTGKRALLRRDALSRWGIWVGSYAALVAVLAVSPGLVKGPKLEVGRVAPQSIYATCSFSVEDTVRTQANRDRARLAVEPVFRVDTSVRDEAAERAVVLLAELARVQGGQVTLEELSVELRPSVVEPVLRRNELGPLGAEVDRLLQLVLSQPLVSDRKSLEGQPGKNIAVHLQEGVREVPVDAITTVEELSLILAREARITFPGNPKLRAAAVEIVTKLARPNLRVDEAETISRRESAARRVPAEMRSIQEGEIIIREGERITSEHLRVVAEMMRVRPAEREGMVLGLVGTALLVLVCFLVMAGYLRRFHERTFQRPSHVAVMGIIMIGTTAFARIVSLAPLPGDLGYVVPVAGATMVVGALLHPQLGLMVALILAVLVGAASGYRLEELVVALTGGVVGVYGSLRLRHRLDLARSGMLVGLVNLATIAAVALVPAATLGELAGGPLAADLLWGITNGIFSALVAAGGIPVLERVFGLVTDSHLLELADLNQPILKRLEAEAPGTYQASLVVGNLGEAAANAIGANGLLARVGGYYHDIGKVKKPGYFSENQMVNNGKHGHTGLSPRLSSLVLLSHVKDGVELAHENRLPERVVELVRQHHGTTLTSFFYDRARKEEPDREGVRDIDFRYPGPRPQRREAAILLLADSVEAAARSIDNPSPKRIRDVVEKILSAKLQDHQLDECDLTLKDLGVISDTFIRVLVSYFHRRVKYTQEEQPGAGPGEGRR